MYNLVKTLSMYDSVLEEGMITTIELGGYYAGKSVFIQCCEV